MDWSLFGCARKGHVTYAPDEPDLRDRLMAPTAGGTAWRCLRCGTFVTLHQPRRGQPGRRPPGRRPPGKGKHGKGQPGRVQHGSGPAAAAPLPRRGKELRDELILRVFAVERFIRFVICAAAAYGVGGSPTTGPTSSGRSTTTCRLSGPCTRISASTSAIPSCSADPALVHARRAHAHLAGHRAGRLRPHRADRGRRAVAGPAWASTSPWWRPRSSCPTRLRPDCEDHPAAARGAGDDLLLVIYLVWTKRLFGVRGGKQAYEARLHTESVMEQAALAAAAPAAAAPAAAAPAAFIP